VRREADSWCAYCIVSRIAFCRCWRQHDARLELGCMHESLRIIRHFVCFVRTTSISNVAHWPKSAHLFLSYPMMASALMQNMTVWAIAQPWLGSSASTLEAVDSGPLTVPKRMRFSSVASLPFTANLGRTRSMTVPSARPIRGISTAYTTWLSGGDIMFSQCEGGHGESWRE
jgi:hypothetical protein